VCLSVDDPVWDPSTFSKNRERVLNEDFAACFLDAVLNADKVKGLVSSEHFSVDGTLIQAWASIKSFRRKDGADQPPSGGRNGERDFHKEKPANETHASTTDPDARLYRKERGKEAKPGFIGHILILMPAGTIEDQHRVRARCHLCTDFLQMLVHRFGVDGRHDDGGTNSSVGAYGTEQMHRVVAGVPHHGRA
jgi:hypothetical protein